MRRPPHHPLLAAPPTLSLWRAPTDNDRIGGMAARWAEWGIDRLERHLISIDRDGPATVVRSEFRTAAGVAIPHEARYSALEAGGVHVEESVVIPESMSDLARIGTVLETVAGLEAVEWFGSGPHETYPDRKRAGLIGRWRSSVAQYVPYIRPQENGGHADVRWLRLSDDRAKPPTLARPPRAGLGDPFPGRGPGGGDARRRARATAGDDRASRRGPPRARHRELRPRHAARVPRRAGHVSLVLDAHRLRSA